MKKFLKKAVCSVLVLCTLASSCVMFAAESDAPENANGNTEGISPLSSMIVMDTLVSQYGGSWYQQSGYIAYRIWVANTTNYTLTVRITEPNNSVKTFYVPAGNNQTYTNNNAVAGVHTLSFSNGTNYVSGTVRVRASTVALY